MSAEEPWLDWDSAPSVRPGERTELPISEVKPEAPAPVVGHIVLTPASSFGMKRVHWTWHEKIPDGSLTLLAGREGIGKSTVAYDLAASLTTGKLPGEHLGKPRSVIVVATEDSWEHTIVPRLAAAGAALERVFKADVEHAEGAFGVISLPADIEKLDATMAERGDVALILLDPLMSRLHASLDPHKDGPVRQALEPLTRLADKHRAAILGLIHVNKSRDGDPVTRIMGSRAFAAVARAVLFVQLDKDGENPNERILQVVKSNLGPIAENNLLFDIESIKVGEAEDGDIFSSHIRWIGITDRTVEDALISSDEGSTDRGALEEAVIWLKAWLTDPARGGEDAAMEIKKVGRSFGHSDRTLDRAKRKMGLESTRSGHPPKAVWRMPGDRHGIAESWPAPKDSDEPITEWSQGEL